MNYLNVRKIDNGFLVEYWGVTEHKVYCATMDDVAAAITTVINTPSVVPQLGLASSVPTAGYAVVDQLSSQAVDSVNPTAQATS